MTTIARGTKKYREALLLANRVPVWAHTLTNGFTATPLPEHCYVPGNEGATKGEYLLHILDAFSFAKLKSDKDTYRLQVHSNEWYEWNKQAQGR